MSDNYINEINKRIDEVFSKYPELPDHRKEFPWLTGYLGDPNAGIWFLAENPSLTTARKAKNLSLSRQSTEYQWAVSPGDKLFRESLVKYGFKEAPWDSVGGWHCYITDVIKQAEIVEEWHKKGEEYWNKVSEIWSEVLEWELANSKPRLVVIMGKQTKRLVEHLSLLKSLPFPNIEVIQHYSYIGSRPQGILPPMDPGRVSLYHNDMERIANTFSKISKK
jgi:hypothetical protein